MSGSGAAVGQRAVSTVGPVLIIGSGLLGASLGLALRAGGVRVYLEDSSPTSLRLASDVGAGDAFVGALAAELARGRTLVEGCRFATAVATLTVTKPGAQASYPSADEVESIRRGEHA